ncbi:hypothetical protein DMC25_20640 [Caulobacter sp. D4A]|uniref:hypothetical protein n=1 Tax=unclassified Caulobacter TaxID=2648921 RepID=UPI000D738803|nr:MULTISPECIES: hypothetical protein [unclassified Caulobacter]PXA81636.1 hypothetical protein DMC25_20640 [Caulobacter sp. D4A]PXA89717.1 hypothetical protein DMC18_16255 [Caulobacter sp. D5]
MTRIRTAGKALSLLAALAVVGAAQAAPTRKESWGKPGVSYLKYRTDAAECLHYVEALAPVKLALVDLTFGMDVPVDPDVGSREPSASGAGQAAQNYAEAYRLRMNRNWRNVRDQATPALEKCLAERGYSRFKLSEAEQKELKDLRVGTPARHLYLWRLGSEPR